jgi:hypothetical protein
MRARGADPVGCRMRHELHTEIDIPAAPEEVWSHLTDLAAYAEWNPFIVSAAGSAVVGGRLALRMEPPGGRPVTMRPTVTAADQGGAFEWLGHLGVPGVFDGRHRFELEPTDSGTRLTQREEFTGLLVRPFRRSLDTTTRAGFDAMNDALRRRVVESRSSA